MPPADEDLLDDETHESLSTLEVKSVDPAGNPLCEASDSPAQRVVDREIVSLANKSIALFRKAASPGIDLTGTSLQVGQFDEAGLVEVSKTTTLCSGRLELALEAGELRGEQLVVGCRTVWQRGLPRRRGARQVVAALLAPGQRRRHRARLL
jgi:hypothetical protein